VCGCEGVGSRPIIHRDYVPIRRINTLPIEPRTLLSLYLYHAIAYFLFRFNILFMQSSETSEFVRRYESPSRRRDLSLVEALMRRIDIDRQLRHQVVQG
jgi:hypothetical protein